MTAGHCSSETRVAEVGVHSPWGGFVTWHKVKVIAETSKRYRVEAFERMKIAGRDRYVNAGDSFFVPKRALRFV